MARTDDKKKSYDFNKKFMHPTRRKLVDMVHTGEYDKNPVISTIGTDKKEIKREVGEEWTDDSGNIWVQKEGYKIKKSKNTDRLAEVRKQAEIKKICKGEKCEKKGIYGYTDKHLIKETGLCSSCLVEEEQLIKHNGDYETYVKYKLFCRAYKEGSEFIYKLDNAYNEAKQKYEFVDGDGKVQTWKLERPIEEVKQEIKDDLEKAKEELDNVVNHIQELYDKLKDKDYTLVTEHKAIRE